VRGIGIGVQEADGDGGDPEFLKPPRSRPHRGFVERCLDAAVEAHALGHLEAQAARHQRRGILHAQVEQVVAALETHVENVAEARGRQHSGDGTAALDHRVGDERRPVHHVGEVGDGDPIALEHGVDALGHRLGGIMRSGEPLVHGHPGATGIVQGKIRERPSNIDPHTIHATCPARCGPPRGRHGS
jgi:hypothetical protein